METLQEFMLQTKGAGYLLAAGILVSAIYFWSFLTAREKKD